MVVITVTKQVKKPSWEETFMNVAVEVAKRSHCQMVQIGAVVALMAKGGESILTFGYNGPSRGDEHCDEVGCTNYVIDDRTGECTKRRNGYCRGAHAEMNAMLNAAREGIRIEGATVFTTLSPCYSCARQLVNAGINGVVFLHRYAELFPERPAVEEEDARALQLLQRMKRCHQIFLPTK